MGYWEYPKYVSVAEKKAKAEKKLKQLMKKNPGMKPVVIEGNALAKTWWGKAWNTNLEKYADYSNRIGRGRSYVRHCAVLDLQIVPGEVRAMVQGSASTPYTVTVKIKPVLATHWAEIKNACRGRMDSLKQLLAGKFPKELEAMFTRKGTGLFPAPEEIDFSCSCPDWATMCKHVAAALYGIGARLDENPALFFTLRKVDVAELISETIKDSKADLLEKARKKSARVLEDDSLSELFGIDLDDPEQKNPTTVPPAIVRPAKEKSTVKKSETKKSKTKKPVIRKPAMKKPAHPDDLIFNLIRKHKQGVRVIELIDQSKLDPVKVRNIIVKLKQQGKIENVDRGVYKVS
ncbi:MAG: hypothetical protein WA081_15660 [Desulfosalsimonadaceae bacterium]